MTFFDPEISPAKMSSETSDTVALRKQLRHWCKASKPTPHILTITPELAGLMLERNLEHNRKRSGRAVAEYHREIKDGRMMLTNQGIGFDTTGRLVDGQHRLMACVSSDNSFDSLVVFGLDPESFLFVDSGYKRTTGHKVGIAGYPDSNNLAAAARVVLLYDLTEIDMKHGGLGIMPKGRGSVATVLPAEFVVDFIRETPKFVAMQSCYTTYTRFRPITKSLFHALHWIIAEKHPRLADAFVEQLALGESLNRSDNVYRLREHLVAMHMSKEQVSKAWQLCWCIDAFNDTRRGKTTKFVMNLERDFPKVLS